MSISPPISSGEAKGSEHPTTNKLTEAKVAVGNDFYRIQNPETRDFPSSTILPIWHYGFDPFLPFRPIFMRKIKDKDSCFFEQF